MGTLDCEHYETTPELDPLCINSLTGLQKDKCIKVEYLPGGSEKHTDTWEEGIQSNERIRSY